MVKLMHTAKSVIDTILDDISKKENGNTSTDSKQDNEIRLPTRLLKKENENIASNNQTQHD